MKRLYFLLPNVETAHKVVDELLLTHVEERYLHVIAADSIKLGDLPEASLLQKSDFIPAVERGVALGGATGVLFGLVALAMPGFVIAGGALLAMGLVGAGMGAWLGGMIGLDVGNSQVKKFQSAIEQGEILMLIDIPKDRIDEIKTLVKKHHPEADFEGTEPHIPAFP
ncbi:MAG: DUF1269 domain-containing protein [Thiotrichaceae bacterium]|nr:MAG: DUF1269 domain-containing protein [Thiotrichaceae bacterium]